MSRLKTIYKYLPIIVVAILIIASAITSVIVVSAAGGSFHETDVNWEGYNNSLSASKNDTYPYNSSTATISSMSLDVLYGTKRDFVFYHGEFPYNCIYDSDGNYKEGWDGMYAEDGTTASGNNPNFGASSTVTSSDYWGNGITDSNFTNQPTAEQINAGNMVSVRLWASSKTQTGFGMWFGSILYIILNGAAWLATTLISLIVRAKNLNMDMIMNILNLDSLNDALTKNFIYNSETVSLSAFTGFCIIALILSIVAFVIRWVKGADKTRGIWEIIGTAGLGLLVIGMCLTGRISSLGSSISTMANTVMYTAAQSLSSSGQGNAFLIDIKDKGNETEIAQMCEMSLVNKAYIDLQLSAQFNVSKADDLNFSKFGDPNGTEAKKYLSGVSNADMKKDFNNNLGYYYWFANSSAVDKTANNKTYPSTDTLSVTNKLSSMVTYLQHQYNANSANPETAALIKNVTESIANPAGGPKFLALLVFAIALVLMGIVLLKYALNVVIGKLELFVSLLGMIIAGPLILTSNKKLVGTGKMILGMLTISFIEITIYSVIFDIIIYTVSAMFSPEIPNLLATVAILLLLLKFNPIIAEKIKQLLDQTERKISPALADGKRAIKNYAKNKAKEGIAAYDNKRKVVGYDENGNAITESRKGDALSKLMHHSANALLTDGHDHQGAFKIGHELNKERKTSKLNTAEAKRKAAQNAIDNELDLVNEDADLTSREVNAHITDIKNSAGEWDEKGHLVNINEDGLSEQEIEAKHTLETLETDLEDLKNMDRYKKLVAEQEFILKRNAERVENGEEPLEMDEQRKAELASLKMKIAAKKKQIDDEKRKIEESIKERAAKLAFNKAGIEYKGINAGTIEEQLKNASREKALADHKAELERVLQDGINTMAAEVNDLSTTKLDRKIGGKGVGQHLNTEAATAQAAAMLQLTQLQNGFDVLETNKAKKEVLDIINKVATRYDGTVKKTDDQNLQAAKDAYKHTTIGSEEHKQAKETYKIAKTDYKHHTKDAKSDSKEAYKQAKDDQNVAAVVKITASEYIASAVMHKAEELHTTSESKAAEVIARRTEKIRDNTVDNSTNAETTNNTFNMPDTTSDIVEDNKSSTDNANETTANRTRPNPYSTPANSMPFATRKSTDNMENIIDSIVPPTTSTTTENNTTPKSDKTYTTKPVSEPIKKTSQTDDKNTDEQPVQTTAEETTKPDINKIINDRASDAPNNATQNSTKSNTQATKSTTQTAKSTDSTMTQTNKSNEMSQTNDVESTAKNTVENIVDNNIKQSTAQPTSQPTYSRPVEPSKSTQPNNQTTVKPQPMTQTAAQPQSNTPVPNNNPVQNNNLASATSNNTQSRPVSNNTQNQNQPAPKSNSAPVKNNNQNVATSNNAATTQNKSTNVNNSTNITKPSTPQQTTVNAAKTENKPSSKSTIDRSTTTKSQTANMTQPNNTVNNDRPIANDTTSKVSPIEERQVRQKQQSQNIEQQAHNFEQQSVDMDISSIINGRTSQTESTPTDIPTHTAKDDHKSYEQDEAEKTRRQSDIDFWSNKRLNRPDSKN